jgi:hypothetical protein
MGILAAGAAVYQTEFMLRGVVAGIGTVAVMLLQIGPLLLGAIAGGVAGLLNARYRRAP